MSNQDITTIISLIINIAFLIYMAWIRFSINGLRNEINEIRNEYNTKIKNLWKKIDEINKNTPE